MVRRKKSGIEELPTNLSEDYVRMDIEIQALRAKNKALVQSVAKFQQEKALVQKQMTGLQEEYFKLNSKFLNLKNIFSTVDSASKVAFTNLADGVNQLAKVMHLCSVASAVSGLNKEPQTLTVKPHTVNGTVIQNPTISLSRLNETDSPEVPQITAVRRRISPYSVPDNETIPSTSGGLTESFSAFFNNSNQNQEGEEVSGENISGQSGRNTLALENPEEENGQEQYDMLSDEEEEVNDHSYCQRLMTIDEEPDNYSSINSTGTVTDRVQEIRIYLSPLSAEHTKNIDTSEVSVVGRSSSLTPEASNSILDNTLLNESRESLHKRKVINSTIDISMPSPSESRFDCFEKTMDSTKTQEINRPSCSFMGNMSSIVNSSSMNENDNKDLSDQDLKIVVMKTLDLMEKRSDRLASSTPVFQIQRQSKRLVRKSNEMSESTSKSPHTPIITKRRKSSKTGMIPQVVIKRLKLNSPVRSQTNILKTTEIVLDSGKELISKTSETSSDSDNDAHNKETVRKKRTVKTKGKENRTKLIVSNQTIKSSPRPKRAARPTALREKSLKKKMRRSR